MSYHHHHLKRLQHSTNLPHSRKSLPDDENALRESMKSFTISNNDNSKYYRPFNPAPHRARRGGSGRGHDRQFYSSISLPKRAINYDLAESFVDHSTNPLSSDLYKVRFKHSAKQWPNGRFINYKENVDKSNGETTTITCTRTIPLVSRRKQIPETQQNEQNAISIAPKTLFVDPIAQEQKKKLANKQMDVYANLYGCRKLPQLPLTLQIKKVAGMNISKNSSATVSLLGENKEDQQC